MYEKPGFLRDKTLNNKLLHIPNNDKQNVCYFLPTNEDLVKEPYFLGQPLRERVKT